MVRAETIIIIKAICSAYPTQTNNIDLDTMVGLWTKQLESYPYKNVVSAVNEWISENKFMPTIADIKENISIGIDYTNPWYKHFPQQGIIEYNDKDVAWAKWEDWKMIPDELSKRITYVPDKNDKTRNLILKQVEEMKRGLNRET